MSGVALPKLDVSPVLRRRSHHHAQSSLVRADFFDFLKITSDTDAKVVFAFRRFSNNLIEIHELADQLCPLKDETDSLKQIKRSKSTLEKQTKWWLVEASIIMGNAVFNKYIEPYTTVYGYDLADIGCTGLGLHMSVSLSSVNSSYFSEVSQSHKNLSIALQGQYTELGKYLLEYFLRAELCYKVQPQSNTQTNIKHIHDAALQIEENMMRIKTALKHKFSEPLKPKGALGKLVSSVSNIFFKSTNSDEIEITLPLQAAILVIKKFGPAAMSLTQHHRSSNSDPHLSPLSPQSPHSPQTPSLSHDLNVHFLNLEAHYKKRKVEIQKLLMEKEHHRKLVETLGKFESFMAKFESPSSSKGMEKSCSNVELEEITKSLKSIKSKLELNDLLISQVRKRNSDHHERLNALEQKNYEAMQQEKPKGSSKK